MGGGDGGWLVGGISFTCLALWLANKLGPLGGAKLPEDPWCASAKWRLVRKLAVARQQTQQADQPGCLWRLRLASWEARQLDSQGDDTNTQENNM